MAREWTAENARQESLNAWIHGLGFVLSIPAGIALARLTMTGEPGLMIACAVYSCSLSGVYLFSTLSHAVRDPTRRHQMRALDQGFIYTLIAGSFTPLLWSYLAGWTRIVVLLAVWAAAAVGFHSKVLSRRRIDDMDPLGCILLGWIPSMEVLPSATYGCFGIMLLGGVIYTIGVYFLQNDHREWYYHPLWHLMVIAASASHYIGIVLYAVLQWDR